MKTLLGERREKDRKEEREREKANDRVSIDGHLFNFLIFVSLCFFLFFAFDLFRFSSSKHDFIFGVTISSFYIFILLNEPILRVSTVIFNKKIYTYVMLAVLKLHQ